MNDSRDSLLEERGAANRPHRDVMVTSLYNVMLIISNTYYFNRLMSNLEQFIRLIPP